WDGTPCAARGRTSTRAGSARGCSRRTGGGSLRVVDAFLRPQWIAALLVAAGCSAPPAPATVGDWVARAGGRWGVHFHDLRTGDVVTMGADETFHAASTMKVLVLVKVFRDVEDGKYRLEDSVPVKDVFPSAVGGEFRVAPETDEVRAAIGKTMSISDLCRHMVVSSDNLVPNVLSEKAGGPSAVTDEARRHGLEKTSVARYIEDQAAFRR